MPNQVLMKVNFYFMKNSFSLKTTFTNPKPLKTKKWKIEPLKAADCYPSVIYNLEGKQTSSNFQLWICRKNNNNTICRFGLNDWYVLIIISTIIAMSPLPSTSLFVPNTLVFLVLLYSCKVILVTNLCLLE